VRLPATHSVETGLSARTVQRAKPGVGIRCRRVHVEGRFVSYWLLPGQQLPADVAGGDGGGERPGEQQGSGQLDIQGIQVP
jgi:hypothetical protein